MGLAGLIVAEIVIYCRGIILKMTDNPHFTTAAAHVALLTTATDELEAADIAASDGGKSLTAAVRQKRLEVFNVMRPFRDYVNEIGDGNEEVLNTTGFALAKLPTPKTELTIPADVKTKTLPAPGEVEVYCKRVPGATGYQIRHRPISDKPEEGPEAENDWVAADPLGQLRQVITELESVTVHEFQMRAIGAGKPSPWSGSVDGLAR